MRRAAAKMSGHKTTNPGNRNIHSNPVSLAIDRTKLRRHLEETVSEMRSMQDWQHCPSLLQGAAQAIAMAIKTIEGFEDAQGVGDEMLTALDAITEMSGRGFVWLGGGLADTLINGFDVACRILMQMPPDMKLKAWEWSERIDLRAKVEAGAMA